MKRLFDTIGELLMSSDYKILGYKEAKKYSTKEVEDLLHRVVADSHLGQNRIKQSRVCSNECAQFTIDWIKTNLK